ncbi:MAG: hypothetical protein KatS3mg114_0650 [Planctomycetaceae bacterium]|nr:MAG: hypothetical protein KatS3mg114_0650 [Planctomycetaceae bacterium]
MSGLVLKCPACAHPLKLRDHHGLGRKGRCPQCHAVFIIDESLVAAQEPAAVPSSVAPGAPSVSPAVSPQGTRGAQTAFPAAPDEIPSDVLGTPAVAITPLADTLSASHLLAQRRQHQRQRRRLVVTGVVLVLLLGGGIGWWMAQHGAFSSSHVPRRPASLTNEELQTDDLVPSTDGGASLPAESTGEPISLALFPSGVRWFIHLRVADLWSSEAHAEEFRFCLGPLAELIEQWLQQTLKLQPTEVEELTLGWIPALRGTPPDFCYVVRLRQELSRSSMIERFPGTRSEIEGEGVFVGSGRAMYAPNLKTIASCPETLGGEMVQGKESGLAQPDHLQALIPHTRREDPITILCEPLAVQLDAEFLVPQTLRPLLLQTLDWFGEGCQGVLWSVRWQDDRFLSNFRVRVSSGTRPAQLREKLQQQVNQLPAQVLQTVRYMQPREVGKRQLIGRLPAMLKVFSLASQVAVDDRDVIIHTVLPKRAAPNVALASLLAWDESTRTDFTRELQPTPSVVVAGDRAVNITEQLQKPIDVDFRREPLQGCFDFIAQELKVTIEIDGDALKFAGYTKNMPQELKLEKTPARLVIKALFEKKGQEQLCLVVDEAQNKAVVTTHAACAQRGIKPYPLDP